MTWQEQREKWNAEDQCAREACRKSLVRRGRRRAGKHRDTGLEYCPHCTRLINDHNPTGDGTYLVNFPEST